MKKIKQEHVAKFAGLVAKVWSDQDLEKKYKADPKKVLTEYGVVLPSGVPIPVIPPRPQGVGTPAVGEAFKNLTFENWELTISEFPGGTDEAISRTGGGTTQISVSSLACIACPVSCFSSLSN